MIQKTITFDSKSFFHARPSAQVARIARSFESVVMLMVGTEIADAKNPMALMRLGHPNGSPVDLVIDGKDEEAALASVLETLRNEFTVI